MYFLRQIFKKDLPRVKYHISPTRTPTNGKTTRMQNSRHSEINSNSSLRMKRLTRERQLAIFYILITVAKGIYFYLLTKAEVHLVTKSSMSVLCEVLKLTFYGNSPSFATGRFENTKVSHRVLSTWVLPVPNDLVIIL